MNSHILLQNFSIVFVMFIFFAGILTGFLIVVSYRRLRKVLSSKNIDLNNKQVQFDIFMTIMPDFMYIKDIESRFIVANKLNSDIFHLPPNNLIGKRDSDFYPKEYADKFYNDEQKVIKTGLPIIAIIEKGLDKKGNQIYISTSKYPIFNKKNKIIGIVGIGRDITSIIDTEKKLVKSYKELKKVYEQLKQNQEQIFEQSEQLKTQAEELEFTNIQLTELIKTRDKFFSIIAHDLRNPVNLLQGFSELLLYRFNELNDEKKLKHIETIHKTSFGLTELLEKLLQWSRLQTGGIRFDPTEIEVKSFIQENLLMLDEMFENKMIDLQIELFFDEATMFGDRNMLDFIIRNLATNAIKYSHRGGQIIVYSQVIENNIEIGISDFGIGMEENVLRNLFDITRNHSTEGTEGETGTGLGLLLCKDFIEKSNGKIWCESSMGTGSKFHFTIPLSNTSKLKETLLISDKKL